MRGGFEKLEVYRLSEKLADQIWEATKGWPYRAWDTVGRQVVRSSDSIGANIAEGSGKGTYVDNRRFILMARGSFEETRHWLRRAHTRKLLTDEQRRDLLALTRELGPRLNAFLNSIPETNQKRPRDTDK